MANNAKVENILCGFWAHFADHIQKITPPSRIQSLEFASMGLTSTTMRFLEAQAQDNLEEYERYASEILGYVIHINIIKKYSCIISYDCPLVIPSRPAKVELYETLRLITVAAMCHVRNDSDNDMMEPYHCTL